ncbi:hypothetical protein RclHR1_00630004 [Rhizophagus clarus]|uniref:Uncharacterized protein n=1 Tax=Rhizophagus clarus TaxID=94130 RepID=A0A2Z6SI12_9GLOM|nr:hypothetical protein RclHR1_00630004 [Rhizophagus clarus]GES83129.1 hypothetical protein GLOIN_2v1803561 [Rhizophagus clarus]
MSSVLSRNRVFINSNNPSIHNKVIDGTQPIITLPFPPYIDPYDLIVKTQDGKIPSRVPNAFIIYRKFFIETSRKEGYVLPMTVISSMASRSWEQESEAVKEEYKRLSREAFDIRNEMLPKERRKKKRGKWNIISFGNPHRTRKSPTKGVVNSSQNPIKDKEVTNTTAEIDNSNPAKLINNETDSEMNPVIPSFGSFGHVNLDFTQYMNNMNPSPDIPEIYNSPGSSIISSPEINDYTPPIENNLTILSEEELFNFIPPAETEIRNIEQFNFINFDEYLIYNNFDIEPSDELNFFSYPF